MNKSIKQYIYDLCDKAHREGSAVLILEPDQDWVDIVSTVLVEGTRRNMVNPTIHYHCVATDTEIRITCGKKDVDAKLDPLFLPPNHGKSGQPVGQLVDVQILRENLHPIQSWTEEEFKQLYQNNPE